MKIPNKQVFITHTRLDGRPRSQTFTLMTQRTSKRSPGAGRKLEPAEAAEATGSCSKILLESFSIRACLFSLPPSPWRDNCNVPHNPSKQTLFFTTHRQGHPACDATSGPVDSLFAPANLSAIVPARTQWQRPWQAKQTRSKRKTKPK